MKNKDIKILDELRDLIPPLTDEELQNLHNSIESEGRATESLIVWKEKGVLVDGHHRYAHCEKLGLGYEVRERSFPSIDMVKKWMLMRQLSRRNLKPKDASRLRGELYNTSKKGVHDGGAGKKRSGGKNCPHSTAETVARETGVSPRTIKNDAKFAEACNTINEMVKDESITLDEKDKIMKKPKNKIQEAAKSASDAKKMASETKTTSKPRQRREPYEIVVEKFGKLKFDQMQKAINLIDEIYQNQ